MLSKEELVELYAQGRIIIVPCAPDDPVYKITEIDDGTYSLDVVYLNATELVSYADAFNEIYFTDKDEARAYVAGMGGKITENI